MGFHKNNVCGTAFLVIIIIIHSMSCLQETMGIRTLEGDQWLVLGQSLQRGQVPPSGGNPCTYIPKRGKGRCTLSEMNIAGRAHPKTFSNHILNFAASIAGRSQKQESEIF
ncbi:hypothetical protein HS088_TW20G00391 [Tripterygium wilfordii]|uniref:Uncharacterized protein n=1 Tax=Tripterygium wilfordii TaxID=458696 RepID=A0A7J7C7B6_TRIWF|nr:hypothetical protein HS088_TW20G00391 [Tripterygium wilfordii]